MAALFLTSCEKESAQPGNGALSDTDMLGDPKDQPWFIRGGVNNTGTFTFFHWSGSCATSFGSTSGVVRAMESGIIDGNPRTIRLTNTTMNGSNPPQNIRLEAGNQSGTSEWGPWYLIRPNFGPSVSVRKSLLMRIKKVPLNTPPTYQAGISYDGSTNTWNYFSASQQGKYEFAEITGSFNLCQTRN